MLSAGKNLGHYEIISVIGKGGMGEVYLGQDTKLDRQVALKVLRAEVAGDAERVKRFVQEAKAASALNHPNILTVFEIGEFKGSRYIATELIKGETLRDRLRGELMTLREVLVVAMQVAAALNAAHSAGIVHRDIKPENIMLRDDGIVKVLDFGLAKLVATPSGSADSEDATRAQVNTQPGTVMGTVLYMSPEQARGKDTDARCDIWSLGIVIYEMLAKQTPFAGETANDSIAAILTKEPTPLDESTPSELWRIIRKTLQKQPDERYQTVKDLLLDVKNLKRELEFSEELERSHVPQSTGSSNVSTAQLSENATAIHSDFISTQNSVQQHLSSAEYVVSQVKRHKFWTALILTAGVFIVAAAAFGYYKYGRAENTNISFEGAKVTRLTNSGKVVASAISPDGKWLVYATGVEEQSLWLQQVAIPGSGTQIIAPAPVGYGGLAFSPDGTFLFYTLWGLGEATGTLYQVPVLGGTAKKLFTGIWGKVSFSPDGKQITYYNCGDDEERLMVANLDGTGQRRLVERRSNEYMVQNSQGPAWSPDAKTIAFTAGTYNPRKVSVATVSVATGEITYFSQREFRTAGDLVWLPDGNAILALVSERTSAYNIWQITYPSGESRQVSTDLNYYTSISRTADSASVAALQSNTVANIWWGNIADPILSSQITSDSDQNLQPAWTPDGKIVFIKSGSKETDIYIGDPRAGNPKSLTAKSNSKHGPTVSQDGRYIAYTTFNPDSGASIWRIDIDGGNPLQLTFKNDYYPSFSPDGKELVLNTYANKHTVWKVGIEGGTPIQLIDKECSSPRLSPDGKQIVCLFQDDTKSPAKLAVFPSTGGTPDRLFALPRGYVNAFVALRWTVDSRSFIYPVNKAGVTNLWAQPVDGTAARQLTNFTTGLFDSYDLSLDGKQIAVSRGTTTSDVVLISGFKK